MNRRSTAFVFLASSLLLGAPCGRAQTGGGIIYSSQIEDYLITRINLLLLRIRASPRLSGVNWRKPRHHRRRAKWKRSPSRC
jgi:hypothetical protein